VPVQIEWLIGRLGRVVHRRAVGDDHQDAPLLGPRHQPIVRPQQGLAVDVFLQQALAHHETQVLLGPSPRRVGGLEDDVAQVVQAARIGRLARRDPRLARLTALPGAGGEAEDLHLHAAAFQRPREDVSADGRDHDRAPAHGTGVVQQQGHHRVAEGAVALGLEQQGAGGIHDDAAQARGVQHAFLEVKGPAAALLRHQPALQLVGQPGDDGRQGRKLLVQEGAKPPQLDRVAQVGGVDRLVEGGGEDAIGGGVRAVRPLARPLRRGVGHLLAHVGGVAVGLDGAAVGARLALLIGLVVVGRALHRLAVTAAGVFVFLVLIVGRIGLLRIGLVLAGVFRGVVALAVAGVQVQRAQNRLHPLGEDRLVVGGVDQRVQLLARPRLQPVAHQIQQGARPVRRARSRQALPHHQGHGLVDRHSLGVGDAQGPRPLQPRQGRRVQIGPHPGHDPRAQPLDPGLLQRVIHLGRRRV